MEVLTYSHRYAEEILQHPDFKEAYEQVMAYCKECPLPVYKGKSKNKKLDVVQQIMNTYFKLRFVGDDWKSEEHVSPEVDEMGVKIDERLRADFFKVFKSGDKSIRVLVEVEFGNVASSYRDYFKFQLSYAHSMSDIGIIILPTNHLCGRIDSAVANFEKAGRELKYARLTTTVPLLVIGLSDIGVEEDDLNALGVDLKILKGAKKKHAAEHEAIVRRLLEK